MQVPQDAANMSIAALGLASGDTLVVRRTAHATSNSTAAPANGSVTPSPADGNDLDAQVPSTLLLSLIHDAAF